MAQRQTKKRAAQITGVDKKLYTLDVFIRSGPMAQSFAKKNRVISRTIQIRGDQTLEELHEAIFEAFDREEEHMYEFRVCPTRLTGICANFLLFNELSENEPGAFKTFSNWHIIR